MMKIKHWVKSLESTLLSLSMRLNTRTKLYTNKMVLILMISITIFQGKNVLAQTPFNCESIQISSATILRTLDFIFY